MCRRDAELRLLDRELAQLLLHYPQRVRHPVVADMHREELVAAHSHGALTRSHAAHARAHAAHATHVACTLASAHMHTRHTRHACRARSHTRTHAHKHARSLARRHTYTRSHAVHARAHTRARTPECCGRGGAGLAHIFRMSASPPRRSGSVPPRCFLNHASSARTTSPIVCSGIRWPAVRDTARRAPWRVQRRAAHAAATRRSMPRGRRTRIGLGFLGSSAAARSTVRL
jgi:hypothetical protein